MKLSKKPGEVQERGGRGWWSCGRLVVKLRGSCEIWG